MVRRSFCSSSLRALSTSRRGMAGSMAPARHGQSGPGSPPPRSTEDTDPTDRPKPSVSSVSSVDGRSGAAEAQRVQTPKVAQAVPPAGQHGGPDAWPEPGGHLAEAVAQDADGLDLDLLAERHAVRHRLDVEPGEDGAPDDPHAALRVAQPQAEEHTRRGGEDPVAEAVLAAHGALLEVGVAVAVEEVELLLDQELDELVRPLERVGAVGVAGDEDVALGVGEAGLVRPAVAAAPLHEDLGAARLGLLAGAVLRVAVDDEDVQAPAALGEGGAVEAVDGRADAVGLVERGEDDGHAQPGLAPHDGVARHAAFPPALALR